MYLVNTYKELFELIYQESRRYNDDIWWVINRVKDRVRKEGIQLTIDFDERRETREDKQAKD